MRVLVVGASGATGRLLVGQLLARGAEVRIIVRPGTKLPAALEGAARLEVVRGAITALDAAELGRHVAGCEAIASCLGHTMTLAGIYGRPRDLVTEAMRRLSAAVAANKPARPVRLVLMNTAGNANRDLDEKVSLAERAAVGLVRALLPPHRDNEAASDVLRRDIGQHDRWIEWAVVRPDTLIDAPEVTPYEAFASPTRSAIFNPGRTSRINVAAFMAELITDPACWARWKGQMPVLYNREAG